MDTTHATPPALLHPPRLGDVVLYVEKSNPHARAAQVGHVHEDGRTVDLVVLLEGNPESMEQRSSWACGNGVHRVRTAIVCAEDDPAGARHWKHR